MARSIERLGERGTPCVMVKERYLGMAGTCGGIPLILPSPGVVLVRRLPEHPAGALLPLACGPTGIPEHSPGETHENGRSAGRYRAVARRRRLLRSRRLGRRHAVRPLP